METELEKFLVTYIEKDEGVWKGEDHFFFDCMAENKDHAREQCMNAYPECIIIEVDWLAFG